MDDEDTTHLGSPTVGAVMAAGLLVMVVVVTAALAVTGCAAVIVVQGEPVQVKPADMVGPPAAFITRDGGSKHAQISIPAERSKRQPRDLGSAHPAQVHRDGSR